MMSKLYQGLSALCFVAAIMSVAPYARAADGAGTCSLNSQGNNCTSTCPLSKPKCDVYVQKDANGSQYSCSACYK